MANGDNPIDPNLGENLGNQANQTNQILGTILTTLRPLYDLLTKTFGQDQTNNVSRYNDQLQGMQNRFTQLKQNFDTLQGDLNFVVQFNGDNPVEAIDRWTRRFEQFSSFISNARIFDRFADNSGTLLNDVSTNIEGIQKGLSALGVNVNLDRALIQNASQAEKLESGFIGLAAATGSLNDLFVSGGAQLKDLTALTGAYANRISDVADATGFSVPQTLDFAKAIGQIPDTMDKTIQVGDRYGDQVASLEVAMRLMSGTGRSQSEVVNTLTVAYEKLSQSQGVISDNAQRGAELFALMSNAANVLRLRFSDVSGFMDKVAEQFQFVGDNTDAAARILARYTDALRETGLTSRASMSIIQEMVGQMSNLTTGTKAFLSLRTGGPGGLQGAFQVENLIRQGRLDQVVQMMERAFRQQAGGRIFTLAEAGQSQEAAAGFMRQRQLLQSGVFGIGRGMGDDQATRFLEALGNRGLGGGTDAAKMLADSLKPGQDALQEVNERGTNIQERSWNELKRLNNAMDRNAVAAELSAGVLIRNTLGATGGRAENLTAGMAGAQGRAARGTVNAAELQALGTQNWQEQARQLVMLGRQAIDNGLDSGKQIVMSMGDLGKMAARGMDDLMSDVVDLTTTDERDVYRQQTQANVNQALQVQQRNQTLGPQKIVLEIQTEEGVNVSVKEKPTNIDVVNPVAAINRSNLIPAGF